MTVTERTDKFIELLEQHDPTGYIETSGSYSKLGTDGLFDAPAYYMFSNQLFCGEPELLKTSYELRSFIAYAWYLRINEHVDMNANYVQTSHRGPDALAIYEFLKTLQIPYHYGETCILLNETFDIARLRRYKHPLYDKRSQD